LKPANPAPSKLMPKASTFDLVAGDTVKVGGINIEGSAWDKAAMTGSNSYGPPPRPWSTRQDSL